MDEFTSVPSIENESLSLQPLRVGQVSVLKSKETEPFVNILVIENPISEDEECPLDLNELLPDEASEVSIAHWVPNWPTVPSRVHSELIVDASKPSS